VHPRIQARRESLSLARKRVIVRAIGDLCASMEYAGGEIERVAGFRPPELTEMTDAYRLVIAWMAADTVSEDDVASLSGRINVSAQVALIFIQTLANKYIDDVKSSETLH